MTSNDSDRRYSLHSVSGWFEIHADFVDRDFPPHGMWVTGPIIGKSRTREDAATFMRGYLKAKTPRNGNDGGRRMTLLAAWITRSTAPLVSTSPPPPDGMVLVECASCGAHHHNGPEVQLPLCGPCFDDFIGGGD